MTKTGVISGWGNYPRQEVQLLKPSSCSSLKSELQKEKSVIPRGMARSYGDSAIASVVMQTTCFDHFLEFNTNEGLLEAEAGITLREILKMIVPNGWFLPVTPGSSYVTLGGAIASDVHGKNHHIAGTFGQHVKSMRVLLGTGDIVTASSTENVDLFRATCGGMGLTGVIVSATIKLIPILSSFINQKTIKADCIESACEAFEMNSSATYSVAWIDCLTKGKNLGRSVLMLGEHAESGGLELAAKDPVSLPVYTPAALLNSITIKTFNRAYWHKAKHNKSLTVPLMPYFYPLDVIGSWNKFYGKAGFLQYQCVIPKDDGITNMRKLLTEIAKNGEGSFLAVLKQFGKANDNLLSFPAEGYTLALDFKLTKSTINLLHKLDDIVSEMGGKVYLSKDAVMREAIFKKVYPKWQEFELIRQRYGAIGKFSSEQSKRLGLA
jgi:hypothetical protein